MSLREFFLLPRRYRELCEIHENRLWVLRVLKAENKKLTAERNQARKSAKDRGLYWKSKLDRIPELEKEVTRLRELNGATNQKYVYAQECYDQLRLGRRPRF